MDNNESLFAPIARKGLKPSQLLIFQKIGKVHIYSRSIAKMRTDHIEDARLCHHTVTQFNQHRRNSISRRQEDTEPDPRMVKFDYRMRWLPVVCYSRGKSGTLVELSPASHATDQRYHRFRRGLGVLWKNVFNFGSKLEQYPTVGVVGWARNKLYQFLHRSATRRFLHIYIKALHPIVLGVK